MNNNGSKIFRNEIIKNHISKKFNFNSPKNINNAKQKVFLAASLRRKKSYNKEKKVNQRYKNFDIYTNISKGKIDKFLTPRSDANGISKYIIKYSNKNSCNTIDDNEKCFILNNNLLEYNSIISLLGKILSISNSNFILIKIKNYIKNFLVDKNKSLSLNNSFYKKFSDESHSFSNTNLNIITKKETKEEKNKEESSDILSNIKNKYNKHIKKNLDKTYLLRKIKKLSQKINELEEKYRIEQLKYLFFIVEQEKKIAELEKNFDKSEIPLDERIIEKMKELKCLPNYFKPEIDENKKHPLSSKIRNSIISNDNNDSFLKSRNKKKSNFKDKYSFDKDVDPFIKKNQSQILNIQNKDKEYNISKSRSKGKISMNKSHDINEIKKQNRNNGSKSVHQLFKEKNFFISHPKLKYVKNSQEKNHFQKLKTKEQLNGISNLLSNINLGSKFQKSAVNDFSYFINNSMINIEKYKEYHNYIKIEQKFEESLKLKRKPSL